MKDVHNCTFIVDGIKYNSMEQYFQDQKFYVEIIIYKHVSFRDTDSWQSWPTSSAKGYQISGPEYPEVRTASWVGFPETFWSHTDARMRCVVHSQ